MSRTTPDQAHARLHEVQSVVDDHIIIAVTDRRGTIVTVNRAFARISGYREDELIGQNHRILSSGVHSRDFWKQMWRTVSSGSAWHGEVCNRAKHGTLYWVDTTIFPLKDETGAVNGYLAVRIEITDMNRIRTALVDSLTGLPGRAFLMHRLRGLLRQAADRPDRVYAVCFIDLDNFKYVNDSLGHTTGDRLLLETARRITAAITPPDTSDQLAAIDLERGPIAARFGGDEFVVLLDNLSAVEDAVAVAERIKQNMSRPVAVGRDEIAVQCSIGIATGHGRATYTDGEALLRDADTAMYHAKALGKSRYALFDEQMHTDVRRRLTLEGELRSAVANGQIETVYQPIIDLETGTVVSFEALARWQHPVLGAISPTEFIPVAEETGLIIPLAHLFLTRAVQLLCNLRDVEHGAALRMNVNVSRRQLSDPNFLPSLQALLSETGLSPQRLCLEITESIVTASPERVLDCLHAIKALGVHLHMDDFGTGLSSLSLLRTLPLDGIKIDRSFIEAAEGDREAIAILHAIITLGRNLRKVITAEGIENPTHVATVIGLDCDLAQGWVFGQPVSAHDVPAVLALDFSSHVAYRMTLPESSD